jgi:ABC-type multidrug transport system fused ATPase/permease subunit
MDESNIPTFLRLMASVWVNMRLGVLSSLLTLLLCLLGTGSAIEPSLIGVSLTYAIGFAGQLGLLLFASSQLENEFNSVERLKVFCEDLPKEASKRLEADPSPSQWPTNGVITFDNVSLSYPSRPDVLILKNLKFEVKAGEKVGIIGRTGSGKSTIMTALFRLIELINGSIYIDEKGSIPYMVQTDFQP